MTNYKLTSYQLKWIAIITMLIDHAGFVLFNDLQILRMIGRLAFPIFCFLLVEGLAHTSNLGKYFLRLFAFAFVSEVPFDYMFYPNNINNNVSVNIWAHQNIFFTLFIGLLVIAAIDYVNRRFPDKVIYTTLAEVAFTAAGCVVAIVLNTDYDALGILYIVFFYIYKNNKTLLIWYLALSTIFYFEFQINTQILCLVSLIFINMYSGEKGKGMKYFFYAFYPLHIILLVFIRTYLM